MPWKERVFRVFLFYVGKEDIHIFEVKLITIIFFSNRIRLYKYYLRL